MQPPKRSAPPRRRAAPPRKGQAARRRQKRHRQGLLVLLAVVLVAALGVGLPLAINWAEQQAPQSAVSSGPAASAFASSVAPAVVAPSSVAPPPQSESEPPPPPMPAGFLEDEMATLDALLDGWAADATFIKKAEDDEGNPLPEPITVADGGHNVGVYFLDLESGVSYSYNAGKAFYYASVMKAPYAAWLYTLAEQGLCDLNAVITVEGRHVAGNEGYTGVIKTMPMPAALTVEQLLGYLIEKSDTVALKVLLEQWDAAGFVEWARGLGLADAAAIKSVVYGQTTPADAALLMQAMHGVMEQGQYGAQLKQHMLSTSNPMITSGYPVARKYGWDVKAYHDAAVVYAPHPYVLVIMTDKWAGSARETAMFGEIAKTLEQMMAAKWAALGS